MQFARTEGIIPAPETAHAIRGRHRRGAGREEGGRASECILFNLSGHGLFDLGAYDEYLAGKLEDYAYPAEKVEEALAELPVV